MIVRYDFKVKKFDETIVVMQSVALPDMDIYGRRLSRSPRPSMRLEAEL
jgi:hypothetical protein